jgi:hypothetical protein
MVFLKQSDGRTDIISGIHKIMKKKTAFIKFKLIFDTTNAAYLYYSKYQCHSFMCKHDQFHTCNVRNICKVTDYDSYLELFTHLSYSWY